ncbi:trichohyalin-like [Colossoma macropomum]|uniref:trichohyalin-like n=1 Tax=Colossoma macropomum TaxID=42526 RepID=UPI0018646BF1|nr:trichohyalin-like [Colossoma macropomum]
MELNKKERKQKKKEEKKKLQSARETHDEELMGVEQVQQENVIRNLEETVKQHEMEIKRFQEREERLKQKLEKIREKIARKEQKTLRIVQRDENLKRELQAMKERLAQKENQREEEKKVTSQKTVERIFTVSVQEIMKMDRETENQQEEDQQRERRERQRAREEIQQESAGQELDKPEEKEKLQDFSSLVPPNEGALLNLSEEQPEPSTPSSSDRSTHVEDSVRDESSAVPQDAGPQPLASTESKTEDLASETETQVQTDGSTSGQTAEEKTEWSGHDGGGAVCIEVENQEMEPAARSSSGSRMLQSVLSTVRSFVQRLRLYYSAQPVQAEEEDKCEEVSPPRRLIPLGAPAGVLTVKLKTCRNFSKAAAPLKKGAWAAVRITIGRTVKYTVQQPYSDPMCFDEWKHFTIQIQQEDVVGVQQSSLMVVELIITDPDTATPKLMGRDTIKLQEILKKSSVSHQFNLRLRQQKVCKLDADLAFTYGSMGYGYSHQIKHAGRTVENLVEKSLFPRCPPNEDQRDPKYNVITPSALPRLDIIPSLMQHDTPTGTDECRISAGLMDCIQKRGRLLQLHQGLEECKAGEDRVRFLESLILRTSLPCRKRPA